MLGAVFRDRTAVNHILPELTLVRVTDYSHGSEKANAFF